MTDHVCPDPNELTGLQIWEHDYLYHRRNGTFTQQEGTTAMQSMWRIKFERMNDADLWVGMGEITFTSDYTIASDLTDWVKEEIDPNATFSIPTCCTQVVMTPGKHSTRCEKYDASRD